VNRAGAVDVTMGGVATAAGIAIDPLEPVLRTVASNQVLEVVGRGDTLRLTRSQEVLFDRVCVVTERDLDRSLESMNVTVVAGTLPELVHLSSGPRLDAHLIRLMPVCGQ
jgi:hypothetical protein